METLPAMRLDKWLWAARLYKTRTAAAIACRAGHVKINGQNIKPAHDLRGGEVIVARIGDITRTVKVLALLERRVGAKLIPNYLEDQTPPSEYTKPRDPYFHVVHLRPRGSGRPTKKERRDLGQLRQNLDKPE
jgi:ribosome-associated heat shock protein Hsp15